MATSSAPSPKSVARISTPILTSSTSLPESSGQLQYELKRKIRAEYTGQVYISQNLFSNVYRSALTREGLELVTDDCIRKFKPVTNTKGSEELHYKGFMRTLNSVKESLERLGLMGDSIYRHGVEFEVYDKPMAGGIGNDAALKPDLLARVPSEGDAFWEDVEFCVEVKGKKYSDMVLQGATYARSISYAQRGRDFVLVIFYDQTKAEVSFGLFWPSVLCLSHKQDLRSRDGQEAFIRDMAQIWTCNNRWSAGFDDTCNNVQCSLEEFGTLSFRENICFRNSLRGRRTRIDIVDTGEIWTEKLPEQNKYVLRKIQDENEYLEEPPEQSGQPQEGSIASTSAKGLITAAPQGETKPQSTRSSARIADKQHLAEQVAVSMSKRTMANSPSTLPITAKKAGKRKKLILKDSWPLVFRADREAEVFGAVEVGDEEQDLDEDENEDEQKVPFGLYNLLGYYRVRNQEGIVSDTASRYPEDMKPLAALFKDDGENLAQSDSATMETQEPEERIHIRLLIGTEGIALENAKGPRQLLQAILHAIIGYSAIFKRGWIHRDVSIGNVMLMETPKRRQRIEGFSSLSQDILNNHFDKCVGFLSDGDLAINWKQPEKESAKQRSGTPPFMSCFLLKSLGGKVIHTPIDDLESFVWVLFWAVLHALQLRKAKLTKAEQYYWSCLRSRDPVIIRSKREFVDTLDQQNMQAQAQAKRKAEEEHAHKRQKVEETEPGPPSRAFEPVVELLFDWLELSFSRDAGKARFMLSEASAEIYEKTVFLWLNKYLAIGINHLEELPETWDYLSQ